MHQTATDFIRVCFSVEETLFMTLIYIEDGYRGQGLATEMVKAMEKATKEEGIPLISTVAATVHGRETPAISDYDVLLEVPYKDNYMLYNEMSDELKKLHGFCRVVAKLLI